MVVRSPIWLVVSLVAVAIGGMVWQIASMKVTSRLKWRMLLGVAVGAAVLTLISLAKRYPASEAALVFADGFGGFAVGLIPMRPEIERAARAEIEGVKVEPAKRPIYIGLAICFAILISLLLIQGLVFG